MEHDDPKQTSPQLLPQGEGLARSRKQRVWKAMLIPGAITLAVMYAAKVMLGNTTVAESPALAVISAVAIAVFTLVGSIWHHRVIDEHEERAILWANTIGFYVLIVTAFVTEILEVARLLPPVSQISVMMVAFVAALATYAWHRFR